MRQAASSVQRARMRSSARSASIAIAGPSTTSGFTTPSRITVRVELGIAARVVLRHARAIGIAVEIDALVSEQHAHRVEIAHRDTGRVHAQVGLLRELVAALDVGRADFDFVEALEEVLVAVIAVEAMRTARAALVDENDVAIAAHAIERARRRGVQIHGRCARPAGDQEQRIGFLVEADRRHARDEQIDLPSVRLLVVLRHRDACALGGQRQHARRMFEPAGFERELRGQTFGRGHAAKPRSPARAQSRIMRRGE